MREPTYEPDGALAGWYAHEPIVTGPWPTAEKAQTESQRIADQRVEELAEIFDDPSDTAEVRAARRLRIREKYRL